MKTTIAAVTLSLALISSAAMAQERTGDAALGALSGALVLGPVGAVAGALSVIARDHQLRAPGV
jgi:hypothetical protein